MTWLTWRGRSILTIADRLPRNRSAATPSGAEFLCGQGMPEVCIVDMAGMEGQRCRDVSVRPDQIESARLQPALMVGGEVMRTFDPAAR